MSITEDAPVRAPHSQDPGEGATVTWWWLVAASVTVLVTVAVTLVIWSVRSREERTTIYRVLGDVSGLRLDLGDADVQIDGGATAVEVRRVDEFSFGRPSDESRQVENGTVSLVSRCPEQVLSACRVSYRLAVPDNIPVEIETARGNVRLAGVRASVQISTGSGAIAATGFCGFSLRASSDSGDVSAVTECFADRLELRSRSGDVRAVVPAGGRYSVDAQSDTGEVFTRGLTPVEDAPFQIQALSTSGDVAVEAAS